MPTVLVVDDSAMDRGLAGGLLAKDTDTTVTFATNGREALAAVESERPDVVVSDLQMPEMNGLELVEAMRAGFPSVPVILMTARGSEEIASEALRKGAAGYVPKVALAQNLRPAVQRLIADSEADRLHSRLMHSMVTNVCTFQLRNDPELFNPLVAHVQELLRCLPLGDENERLRVCAAVREALWIADAHGNLEVPISTELDDDDFRDLVRTRRGEPPFDERLLTLELRISRDEAIFSVRHEGPALDFSTLPENLHEEAAERSWLGRFVLVSSVIDDVSVDQDGRVLNLLKRAVVDEAEMEVA